MENEKLMQLQKELREVYSFLNSYEYLKASIKVKRDAEERKDKLVREVLKLHKNEN